MRWLVPSRGLWGCQKFWDRVSCWSYHDIGRIRDDDAHVSQGSATQMCVDFPRVGLEKLPSDVDFFIVRLALNCWYYWVREAYHTVRDSGVIHPDVLGGLECIFVLLMRKRFWTRIPKKTVVLFADYSVV
jgi:hypothetical protein